jgi:hypothetical protein
MATWLLVRDPAGHTTVMFKNKTMYARAGTCSAATPDRMIVEWVVENGDPGDVIVTDEGKFVLPLRPPAASEGAC